MLAALRRRFPLLVLAAATLALAVVAMHACEGVVARDAEIRLLRERISELERSAFESSIRVSELRTTLGQSGDIVERYSQLLQTHASLQERYQQLLAEQETLRDRVASLVPIRSPELAGDALLLDRSVPGMHIAGAVCSGSMEPTITCDDLLLLYEADVSDLDVGDVIYFRRPAADCSATLDGRFMLHRIIGVTVRPGGVYFQTKGDALASPDPCLVPAGDVLYKLLTTVRNGRIADTKWTVSGPEP